MSVAEAEDVLLSDWEVERQFVFVPEYRQIFPVGLIPMLLEIIYVLLLVSDSENGFNRRIIKKNRLSVASGGTFFAV